MALSLSSERSLAPVSPSHPFAAFVRWIAQAKAARTRRVALQSLLELDHARLYDLGISRQDINLALLRKNGSAAMILSNARARNSRL